MASYTVQSVIHIDSQYVHGDAVIVSAPGVSAPAHSGSGLVQVGSDATVTVKAMPKESCGWRWDHWEITVDRYDSEHTTTAYTSDERTHAIAVASVAYDVSVGTIIVTAKAVYRFEGTGKILRPSDDGTKILRGASVANPLLDV